MTRKSQLLVKTRILFKLLGIFSTLDEIDNFRGDEIQPMGDDIEHWNKQKKTGDQQ